MEDKAWDLLEEAEQEVLMLQNSINTCLMDKSRMGEEIFKLQTEINRLKTELKFMKNIIKGYNGK